jgi:ribosomal protein L9
MEDLVRNKVKRNHKKGIAAAKKQSKRNEAEARNSAYQALTLKEKLARNSFRVQTKLGTTV